MKLFSILFLLILVSCTTRDVDPAPENIRGFAPIYANASTSQTVEVQAPKATTHAGKIYAYGNYIFQAEENEGVHIIAEGKSKTAHKIAFLKVPFCTEMAVKSNYLYVNNLNDLLVFDISNVAAPQLIRRLPDAFPSVNQQYPNVSGAYFECPDPQKGIVVRWEEKTLAKAECRR
jgi:hypothetical protein